MTERVIRVDEEVYQCVLITKHKLEIAINRNVSLNKALKFILALRKE